jgi:hypothetical protein
MPSESGSWWWLLLVDEEEAEPIGKLEIEKQIRN